MKNYITPDAIAKLCPAHRGRPSSGLAHPLASMLVPDLNGGGDIRVCWLGCGTHDIYKHRGHPRNAYVIPTEDSALCVLSGTICYARLGDALILDAYEIKSYWLHVYSGEVLVIARPE